MGLDHEANLDERALIGILAHGLPLVSRPYQAIAAELGVDEQVVIDAITRMQEAGIITRFGVIVRHRELGYRANAMIVWDVPDEDVTAVGRTMSRFDFVTLCYRRPRRPPRWPFNLFCMIHGRSREVTLDRVAELARACGLQDRPHEILFSRRRFKQTGAAYGRQPETVLRS